MVWNAESEVEKYYRNENGIYKIANSFHYEY